MTISVQHEAYASDAGLRQLVFFKLSSAGVGSCSPR